MKLSEFAQPKRAKQAAKVFESYFGPNAALGNLTHRQAQAMLGRVQGLILEHRRTREYHHSQENPAYTKLMLMQDVLCARLNEEASTIMPTGASSTGNPQEAQKQKQQQLAKVNQIKDAGVRDAMKAATTGRNMNQNQQQALANAAMASGALDEEQVNELSKDTLKSYGKKAAGEIKGKTMQHGRALDSYGKANSEKKAAALRPGVDSAARKLKNREAGVQRAFDRLEEQPVNELSKKTLGSYAKKASRDAQLRGMDAVAAATNGNPDGMKSQLTRSAKRQGGVRQAIDRLTNESDRRTLRRALHESELNQAQVVLAAKDLSDRIQKMLEDAGTMQFKDLPALVNEIRDEVGVPQSTQYSEQVGQVLGALVQAVQQAKTGIDGAMGIVTGQGQMEVPGDTGMAPPPPAPDMGGDMGGELPPPEGDMGADLGGEELPPPPPEEEPGAEEPGSLGRERR